MNALPINKKTREKSGQNKTAGNKKIDNPWKMLSRIFQGTLRFRTSLQLKSAAFIFNMDQKTLKISIKK